MRFEENFRPAPESAAEVRRFVAEHAPADVDIDLAVLLATELATNAVIHARTPFEVAVEVAPQEMRVEVRDGDPTLPKPVQRGEQAVGGRGLRMVETAAAAWGAEPAGPGKHVWFVLPRMMGGGKTA